MSDICYMLGTHGASGPHGPDLEHMYLMNGLIVVVMVYYSAINVYTVFTIMNHLKSCQPMLDL